MVKKKTFPPKRAKETLAATTVKKKVTASTPRSTKKKKIVKAATTAKKTAPKTVKSVKTPTTRKSEKKPTRQTKSVPKTQTVKKAAPSHNKRRQPQRTSHLFMSLEEVYETLEQQKKGQPQSLSPLKIKSKRVKTAETAKAKKPHNRVVGVASTADILGTAHRKNTVTKVPQRFAKYYKQLIKEHDRVMNEIENIPQDSIQNARKQAHLLEVIEAIQRIFNKTYGICEHTGKSISEQRLAIEPWTRYSWEVQDQLERHQRKTKNPLYNHLVSELDMEASFYEDDSE